MKMLNHPMPQWVDRSPKDPAVWDVDRNPQFRFFLLWIGFALPVLAVVGRVTQLQLSLQDKFVTAFSRTVDSIEEIPVRTGRILSSDGKVLAVDTQTYDIAVSYHAIREQLDDDWITAEAKPRLSKKDRRDKQKLADEKRKVAEECVKFWNEIGLLTNRPQEELMQSRRKIQSRVEQIKASVQRRSRERLAALESNSTSDSKSSFWSNLLTWLQANPTRDRSDESDPTVMEEEQFHTVITNVSADVRSEIQAHWMRYPYARVLVRSERTYPQRELAAHLIGHRKPLSAEALEERKTKFPNGDPQDYHLGDPCGLSGLELQYDATLRGVRGKRSITTRRGTAIQVREIQEPKHGQDLVLNLDSEIQLQAERILDRHLKKVTPAGHSDLESSRKMDRIPTCPHGAAIVAMMIDSGAIITAAAGPRFDANLLVTADQAAWDDLMADKRNPQFSRATKMKLTPGSVFKVITAAATIESGAMPPDANCYCRGYLDNPDSHRCFSFIHQNVGHGDVALADALCRSCNVYFYTAARRMGPQPILRWAQEFGIGQPTGIDLPSDEKGHLPSSETQKPAWKRADTLDLSIGQSTIEVTPIQMVRVMAAIANDGYLVTPRIARNPGRFATTEETSIDDVPDQPETHAIQGLHSDTLSEIRKGLKMVVHDPHGTAFKTVRMDEITIAGKTGTAQTAGVDHAWFAGYVPADQPRIAFVVVLEHGGSGGKTAGPVAHEFVKTLLDQGLIVRPASPKGLARDSRQQRR